MSNVWVCVPSARPVPEVAAWAKRWQAQGYKVAVWRDQMHPDLTEFGVEIDYIRTGRYPGYAQATNALIAEALKLDPSCDWCVAGGDDVFPDPDHAADEIAAQCSVYFDAKDRIAWAGEKVGKPFSHPSKEALVKYATGDVFQEVLKLHQMGKDSTFGVMQPTGDRWGDDATSRVMWPDAPAHIDRICGSPWIGREFARRVNSGKGPFWPEYLHNWADEEMQNVAIRMGVFWQRRDLTHHHDHALRNGGAWLSHQQGFSADYARMKPLFDRRKAQGFPGSECIA